MKFSVLGTPISLPGQCFALAREIYGRGVYSAEPGFSLCPNDVVVDLGANVGVFTILAAKAARKVISVEAQSEFIPEIWQNLERNGCADKAIVIHGIIGGKTGVFSVPRRLTAGSHFKTLPPDISFADILECGDERVIDFLKVDIEGSEFDLLNGRLEWLARVRRIAMEVHTEFGNAATLVRNLQSVGFRVTLRDSELNAVDRLLGPTGYLFASK